jgi:hypothetical protein
MTVRLTNITSTLIAGLVPLFVLLPSGVWSVTSADIDLGQFGAKGDGQTDDTINVQRALTYCSSRGATCRISGDRAYLITHPLFLWGSANLQGTDGTGKLVFKIMSDPYLLNIGIRGRNELAAPFSGQISQVTFTVVGGPGGRIIYFWRTRGATVENNTFNVGEFSYSATSSGNDNSWVRNGFSNCIREKISITGNRINASAGAAGSEGIGLGSFDGAEISHNTIIGVGDDVVGIHFSYHVVIEDNSFKSVHGRVFVSNSHDVVILRNDIERMPSPTDRKFYPGIALIYVGFENQDGNSWASPSEIKVRDNRLYYPPGALDQGAAINLNGVKSTTVEGNQIVNDSPQVIATALHLSPVLFSGTWSDPEGIETGAIASVWDVGILGNSAKGKYPQTLVMSGNCVNYKGGVTVQGNSAQGFIFYCDNTVFPADRNFVSERNKE